MMYLCNVNNPPKRKNNCTPIGQLICIVYSKDNSALYGLRLSKNYASEYKYQVLVKDSRDRKCNILPL